MRSFIAPALLTIAQAMDPVVTFQADSVSIDIPISMTDVKLTSFSGGTCSAITDATATATAGNVNVAFPIAACGLAMGDEVEFEIGVNTVDDATNLLTLSFFKYMVELNPEYTFTINFSYGDVAVQTTNLTEADMNVEFKLESYDQTYSSVVNTTEVQQLAGETIYLGLSIDESNTVFDHDAYNFAITHCKIYFADDRTFEYTFFDNERDSCENGQIDFSISYESSAYQWQFSHILFLLNNQVDKEQEIECEVKVCHSGLSGSACQDVADNCNASF